MRDTWPSQPFRVSGFGNSLLDDGIPGAATLSFSVQVASSPNRDELVTEFWWNDRMVAEVRRGADDNRYIDLYPSPSRIPWSFRLEEWLAVMKEAEHQSGLRCT